MRIEGLVAAYSPGALKSPSGGARARERSGEPSTETRKPDTVQISPEARQRLDKVRQRIENGFYNSQSVAEDISDKLGGVLDEMTR